MANINVNKPKFFVNELQFQDSIGNLEMGFKNSGGNTYVQTLPIYNHPEKPFVHDEGAFGNNYLVLGLKEGYWNDLLLPEESTEIASKYGTHFAILGHIFPSAQRLYLRSSNDDFGTTLSNPENYNPIESLTEIQNWSTDSVGNWFEVAGWSMCKNFNIVDNCKCIIIQYNEYMPIGSISMGNYYSSDYGVDFGYNFDILMDGTEYSKTRGGSIFSNTYFKGPPNWISGGAWELGYQTDTGGNGVLDTFQPSNRKRVGRKKWDLSWSGYKDDKLMNPNIINSIYPNTEILTAEDKLDFYSQVLSRTQDQSFIFIPDSENYDPSSFAIARWEDPDFSFEQTSYKTYNFSNSIIESW